MNAPKLRFKEFNDGWQKKELREISQIYDGTHQTPNYIQNGVPFVSVEDISDIEKTKKFISKNDFEKEFKIKPQVNDILMTRITAGIIGATAIVKNNNPLGYYVSLALIRKNKEIDVNYLNQYINCFKFKKELNKRIIHVAFPKKINLGDIGKCKISITSINEQQKIGKMLNILDRKIELQSKKIEDLKLFTKNTISSELNNLQNYNIFKFKDICNIQTGKSNTQDKCDDGIYPFYIRSENIERSNNYIFDCEAVLTIGDGNIGKVFFYKNGKFDCHQRVYVLNNFKNVLGKYVYYYFSSFFYKRAMSMSAKNTVDSVRMEMISDMIIKVPQEKEQIKMINLFSCLDKKLGLEQNKLDKLQELKKGLMQNMFV